MVKDVIEAMEKSGFNNFKSEIDDLLINIEKNELLNTNKKLKDNNITENNNLEDNKNENLKNMKLSKIILMMILKIF